MLQLVLNYNPFVSLIFFAFFFMWLFFGVRLALAVKKSKIFLNEVGGYIIEIEGKNFIYSDILKAKFCTFFLGIVGMISVALTVLIDVSATIGAIFTLLAFIVSFRIWSKK